MSCDECEGLLGASLMRALDWRRKASARSVGLAEGPCVVATVVTKFMHRIHGVRADARADGAACRWLPPEPADLDVHAQGPHVGAADAGES